MSEQRTSPDCRLTVIVDQVSNRDRPCGWSRGWLLFYEETRGAILQPLNSVADGVCLGFFRLGCCGHGVLFCGHGWGVIAGMGERWVEGAGSGHDGAAAVLRPDVRAGTWARL